MAEQVVLAVINRAENLSCLYDMVQAAELKAAGYFPGCSLRLFFLCAEKATQCLQDVLSAGRIGQRAVRSPLRASSASSSSVGAKRAKRVSSSSGSSIRVMISIIPSPESGIASIIRGMLFASNPTSTEAFCIISRKRLRAFGVP